MTEWKDVVLVAIKSQSAPFFCAMALMAYLIYGFLAPIVPAITELPGTITRLTVAIERMDTNQSKLLQEIKEIASGKP
jgi:hypothetical protein